MRRFRIKIQRIMIQDRFLVQLNSYNNGRNQNCSVCKEGGLYERNIYHNHGNEVLLWP